MSSTVPEVLAMNRTAALQPTYRFVDDDLIKAMTEVVSTFKEFIINTESFPYKQGAQHVIAELEFEASLDLFDSRAMDTRDKIKSKMVSFTSWDYNYSIREFYNTIKTTSISAITVNEDSRSFEKGTIRKTIVDGTKKVLGRIHAQMVEWNGFESGEKKVPNE